MVRVKTGLLIAAALGLFVFLFSKPPMPQIQSYHQFVDSRTLMGIPNAMDVLSNIFFLMVGLLGLKELLVKNDLVTRSSWKWFFISIFLIAPGSAWYHLSPNDQTLVWDRLPMSMGFMALYIIILSEFVSLQSQKVLFPALALGIISVFTWVMFSDLRFYFWVQFSSFITIPLILVLFRSRFTHGGFYFLALGFYGLAKWTEVKDAEIFKMTNMLVSGHTLKHVLSAVGLSFLWLMLKVRSEKSVAASGAGVLNPALHK
jgi:hypothetical protein